MKLIHTADLHLSEERPETINAFETVLQTANRKQADVVTIGGDIFDSPEDATQLKTEMRSLCSNNPFDILAIPGNHDADILSKPFDLGVDLQVLREDPCEVIQYDGVNLVGVPFRDELTTDLYSALQEARSENAVNLLLLHCTLDIGFDTKETGAEQVSRYFPVDPATLGELDYDFVLAGHFHSYSPTDLQYGGLFLYPGSPISHTKREEGPRQVGVIDTETGASKPHKLDTFYYDSLTETVTPENQESMPSKVSDWVGERADDECELEISLSGFIDGDETDYNDRLRAAAGDVEISSAVESISHVLDHELYQRFSDQLDDSVVSAYDRATVEGTRNHVRSALARLIDTGEVRK